MSQTGLKGVNAGPGLIGCHPSPLSRLQLSPSGFLGGGLACLLLAGAEGLQLAVQL